MADEKSNGHMKTVATVVVSALATALITLLLNSKANDRLLAQHDESLKDLQRRIVIVETQNAGVRAEITALQSKVNDIWSVVVLGQRPPNR